MRNEAFRVREGDPDPGAEGGGEGSGDSCVGGGPPAGAAHTAARSLCLINGRQRDLRVGNLTLPAGGLGETVNSDRSLKVGISGLLETVMTPDTAEALMTGGGRRTAPRSGGSCVTHAIHGVHWS